jgi:hypothetical protein
MSENLLQQPELNDEKTLFLQLEMAHYARVWSLVSLAKIFRKTYSARKKYLNEHLIDQQFSFSSKFSGFLIFTKKFEF